MFILFENYKAHCDNTLHPFGDYKKLLNLYLLKTLFIEMFFIKINVHQIHSGII